MVPSTQGLPRTSSVKNIKRLAFLAAFAELDSTMNMPPSRQRPLQRSRAFQKRPLSSRATCGRLREAKGLSQGALAADAAIYQDLVSRIENGAANPELDTLGKIAAALGVYPREPLDE
jgi:ribosome-binding protein aMBF1 (putative translation factor)